jgi:hypothetical protein
MPIFYERTETDEKIVIRYKNLPLYYLLFFISALVWLSACALSSLGDVLLSCLVLPIGLLSGIFLAISSKEMWKIRPEIWRARKEGTIRSTGSRFSFSDPLIIEINKMNKKGEEK